MLKWHKSLIECIALVPFQDPITKHFIRWINQVSFTSITMDYLHYSYNINKMLDDQWSVWIRVCKLPYFIDLIYRDSISFLFAFIDHWSICYKPVLKLFECIYPHWIYLAHIIWYRLWPVDLNHEFICSNWSRLFLKISENS